MMRRMAILTWEEALRWGRTESGPALLGGWIPGQGLSTSQPDRSLGWLGLEGALRATCLLPTLAPPWPHRMSWGSTPMGTSWEPFRDTQPTYQLLCPPAPMQGASLPYPGPWNSLHGGSQTAEPDTSSAHCFLALETRLWLSLHLAISLPHAPHTHHGIFQ